MANILILSFFIASYVTASYYRYYSPYQTISEFPNNYLNPFYTSPYSTSSSQTSTFRAIENAKTHTQTPTRSIDSLFLRLPSSYELDELILSSDSVALLRTIQTVATDDSIPCRQQISYLLQLLGRIHTAVEKKKYSAQKLKVIIDGAEVQIKRIEREIKRLEFEKQSLWLDALKKNLDESVEQLTDLYFSFYDEQFKLMPKQTRILGLQKQMHLLKRESDSERTKIIQEKLKLTETTTNIRNIQRKIRLQLQKQEYLINNIRKSQQLVRESEKQLEQGRKKIQQQEDEISQLKDKADSLKAKSTFFQIQVEKLRDDIFVRQAKEHKINAEIEEYTHKVNEEKKKVVVDELKDLYEMTDKLLKLTPSTERIIDMHYYECYGEGSIEKVETGSVVVYIVRGAQVEKYLKQVYGQSVQTSNHYEDVKFQKVNIFGNPWSSKFGYPQIKESPDEDFHCLNPSKTEKGFGTINQISSDYLYVKDKENKEYKFKLGACTRLQTVDELPKIGNTLYWKGVPTSEGEYHLYSGSCIYPFPYSK